MFTHATHLDLSLSQIMDIFRLLTLTYPRYTDSGSRDAVEAVGIELVRRDEALARTEGETKFGVTEQILGWLSNEVRELTKKLNVEYVFWITAMHKIHELYPAHVPLLIFLSF